MITEETQNQPEEITQSSHTEPAVKETEEQTVDTEKIEKKISDIAAVSSELAEEVFSGIMTVKSFG